MGLHETKNLITAMEIHTRLKWQSTELEKIFARYISDKELITRICRELKKLALQTINNPLNKWVNELNR
jgi:HD superfamily phosphohydrolase YqeK